MNKQALVTVGEITDLANTYENFGTKIPQNMRRYVYGVKFINPNTGANEVHLADRLGIAAEVTKDPWYLVTPYETIVHPDELKEDSAPVYIFEGSSATEDRYIRIKSDVAGVIATLWYCDEE